MTNCVCGKCKLGTVLQCDAVLLRNYNEARDAGGEMGGEYLDSINKTDLATLTEFEWQTFLDCVLKEFIIRKATLPPF